MSVFNLPKKYLRLEEECPIDFQLLEYKRKANQLIWKKSSLSIQNLHIRKNGSSSATSWSLLGFKS